MTTCTALTARLCLKENHYGDTCPGASFQKNAAQQNQAEVEIQSLCAFAQPVPDGVSRKVWELVSAMHQDEVTNIIREEKPILRLREHLYAKSGRDKSKNEYIRQKMRELGRLIRHSRKAGRLKHIEDFYVPSKTST